MDKSSTQLWGDMGLFALAQSPQMGSDYVEQTREHQFQLPQALTGDVTGVTIEPMIRSIDNGQ